MRGTLVVNIGAKRDPRLPKLSKPSTFLMRTEKGANGFPPKSHRKASVFFCPFRDI